MHIAKIFIISLLVSLASVPIVRAIALACNIVDIPGGRKIHKAATPLLGGIPIYCGLIAGLACRPALIRAFLPLLIGSTFILILGLMNDIRPLSARLRLYIQVLISLGMALTEYRISFMPRGFWGDSVEIAITVVWLVGVTNAYNYLDGLDGLAGGSAAINLFCFGVILWKTRQYPLAALSVIIIGSSLGFLPFNFSGRWKVFLGEAGSTFLGFVLAGTALVGNWAEDNVVKLSVPILVLGVPIFDMVFTTVMRIAEGKIKNLVQWLEYCDKDHFHHRLVDLGLRPKASSVFIWFITLSLGISAIMVNNDPAVEAYLSLTQAAIIFGIIACVIVIGKRRRSGWD